MPDSNRLAAIAEAATRERQQALKELAAGQKRGHWVWWVFPALSARGGDVNSARQLNGGADLADAAEAMAYARHPELRSGLLQSLMAASKAFETHEAQAPWLVLDAGFGRSADGTWVGGPVDAFKLRCCATLFAAIAYQLGDDELRRVALDVLSHFKGDMVYTAGGSGTAGYVDGTIALQRNVLQGPDPEILRILGIDDWSIIARS